MSNTALLIVDALNDFFSKGSLPVPRAEEVIPPLNDVIVLARQKSWPRIPIRDWHPRTSSHFKPFGGEWNIHCVQNTHGAEFHPNLNLGPDCFIVSKGTRFGEQGYSGFEGTLSDGTLLGVFLKQVGITRVLIGGLATDYCVKATVLDALKHKLETIVLIDACRAVDVNPGDGDRAILEMKKAGAIISTTGEIIKLNS